MGGGGLLRYVVARRQRARLETTVHGKTGMGATGVGTTGVSMTGMMILEVTTPTTASLATQMTARPLHTASRRSRKNDTKSGRTATTLGRRRSQVMWS